MDAVLLSRVPASDKTGPSQPIASVSGRAGENADGRFSHVRYSSEEESDEDARLFERYEQEARRLEATEVRKAEEQAQRAENQASRRKREHGGRGRDRRAPFL